MEQAWNSAVDIDYLESLKLSHCAGSKRKLRTVRKEAIKLLYQCNLNLDKKQKKYSGINVSMYVLSTCQTTLHR